MIADAVADGLVARAAAAANAGRDEKPEAGESASTSRCAEWERELLQPGDAAIGLTEADTAAEVPHGEP